MLSFLSLPSPMVPIPMSTPTSTPDSSPPSVRGLVPCLIVGPVLAALLVWAVPKLGGLGEVLKLLVHFLGVALEYMTAPAAIVLTFNQALLSFIVLSAIFVCGCVAFKYRNAPPSRLISRLQLGLVWSVFAGVILMSSFIETKTNRASAFADPGPIAQSVAAFDARPPADIFASPHKSGSFWREMKFAENMDDDGRMVTLFGYPNCRRVIAGYQSSPAADLYRMEVNGRVVDANTPTSVCTVFTFTEIALTKLR